LQVVDWHNKQVSQSGAVWRIGGRWKEIGDRLGGGGRGVFAFREKAGANFDLDV
jgi:hypothetical protein